MKYIVFGIIIFCTFTPLQAQIIEGVVYDAKTREAIPDVAVYLDGTTFITITDKEGKFQLEVQQRINANLIFSHLLYETLTIENPFEYREKVFFLDEKINTLASAIVISETGSFTRAQLMRVFKAQFLGENVAGKSCVILNEEDIVLRYQEKTATLLAYSRSPLIIENKHLAYKIIYDLQSFSIQYENNRQAIDYMSPKTVILFKGTSIFEDLSPPYNFTNTTRRDEIYVRSRQFFWKSFVSHTLKEENFKIYVRYRQIDEEDYFTITDEWPLKKVQIISGTNMRTYHDDLRAEVAVYGMIDVLCNNKFNSSVIFLSDHFFIDAFGNPDTIEHFLYLDDFGKQRLGDMLPLNYEHNPLPPNSTPPTSRRRR